MSAIFTIFIRCKNMFQTFTNQRAAAYSDVDQAANRQQTIVPSIIRRHAQRGTAAQLKHHVGFETQCTNVIVRE